MGLDSVELLMGFENYFSIEVSDIEAEKIRTVQEMIDSVAHHRKIESNNYQLKDKVLLLLKEHLRIREGDFIFIQYPATDEQFWKGLEIAVGLTIPLPSLALENNKTIIDKLLGSIAWKPRYEWKEIDLIRFCEVVCFANYQKLVNPQEITSKFEIYTAIAGITEDKIGLDFYEIFPDKTFADDFGID